MPEADRIELRGLRLVGIVGALPEEQARAQPLEIDLDIIADLSTAGSSDDLGDTIDYGEVCDGLAAVVATERCALLEHLGERLATAVLDADQRVVEVTLAVRKLRPPVAHDLGTAAVRITRHR